MTTAYARMTGSAKPTHASQITERTSGASQMPDGPTTMLASLIHTVRVAHVLRQLARTRIVSPKQGSRTADNALHPGSVLEP